MINIKSKEEYRIVEDGFGFTVQVLEVKETVENFWFKPNKINSESKWYNVSADGDRSRYFHFHGIDLSKRALPPFNSLEDAKSFIDKVTKKPVIHSL